MTADNKIIIGCLLPMGDKFYTMTLRNITCMLQRIIKSEAHNITKKSIQSLRPKILTLQSDATKNHTYTNKKASIR